MMTGMGLALGIDYSLFVISRFREERPRGLQGRGHRATAATASRAVLFSGTTFVIALLGMFLVPTNVLRSLAAGAIIVGIVSVAAALTLLPAMLADWATGSTPCGFRSSERTSAASTPARAGSGGFIGVLRRPVVILVVTVGLHDRGRGSAARPPHRPERRRHPAQTLPSKQGYLAVLAYFPDQDPNPVEIVARGRSRRPADLATLQATLAADPRFGPGTIRPAPRQLLVLTVPIRGDAVSSRDVAAVRRPAPAPDPPRSPAQPRQVYVGGQDRRDRRLLRRRQRTDPVRAGFRARPQLPAPDRGVPLAGHRRLSILLNLLSVGAAYGLLTLVFLHGVGASSSASSR